QNKTNSNNINLFDLLELLVNFQDEKFDQKSKALLVALYVYANFMAKKQNKTNLMKNALSIPALKYGDG
ncbi:hypothetical protein, partial [Lactobacillus amylovorus]|uniref:hypothetical protein n=1 Tax=Lactobacillus amylovorus TaxID=1604 RepID=UPI00232FDEB4